METSEYLSIRDVARIAGTTSRTLRHYDQIDLLKPSQVAANGHRYYDRAALVTLQRILLLRELGLGLPVIGELLSRETDPRRALAAHVEWLVQERERLGRQIASVETTLAVLEAEAAADDATDGAADGQTMRWDGQTMAEQMFDGFDHSDYQSEVSERWGANAFAEGDAWWRGMSDTERAEFRARSAALIAEWVEAWQSGTDPTSEAAQRLAARQLGELAGLPGTPAADGTVPLDYYVGLGAMYVADPRFTRVYGGLRGAEFVRDAIAAYAETLR